MENIAVFLAVFAISFFTIVSVGGGRAIQSYNKTHDLQTADVFSSQIDQSASLFSSLYKIGGALSTDKLNGEIKIKSIDKTIGQETGRDGKLIKKISVYLVFSDPSLKKDGDGWRMHVRADVTTKDGEGKDTKFLNGAPLQEINSKYSYELDSGAFVFNADISGNVSSVFKTKFIITDVFSGKKDERIVDIKI